LWKPQSLPITNGPVVIDLEAVEDDGNVQTSAATRMTETPTHLGKQIFFKVAEKALTSSTFMGDTTMSDVDFFLQTFDIISFSTCDDGSSDMAVVMPNDGIMIVPHLKLEMVSFFFVAKSLATSPREIPSLIVYLVQPRQNGVSAT